VDGLELLSELGHVEPADEAVIDSALQQLAETVGRGRPHIPINSRVIRRRRLIAAAAASALAAAGIVAVAISLERTGSPAPSGVARSAGAGPDRPTNAAAHGGLSRTAPRESTVTAILTAFSASSDDILMVTKTMSGDYGSLGPTVIWLSPVEAVPGATVRSRILTFSLAGTLQADRALTYLASAAAPATASGCSTIFSRPRVALPPALGVRGTLTAVSYQTHVWGTAAVAVQAATLPGTTELKACLKYGQWHIVPHGGLAGDKLIELADVQGYERLWVSSASYLPVRLISTGPGADTITFTFRFLPPTAANQAALTPPIPKGFAKRQL
jgi:hypothetical protein